MPSPTELSDTILDILIEKYGNDLKADVFTDENANQLLALQFADSDRYTLRVEARDTPADDPARHQDFADPRTGAHVRITDEALMVFTEAEVPKEDQGERGRAYMLYPLHRIYWVNSVQMPGGQTAVYMAVGGVEQGPGLTFTDTDTAESFERALKSAARIP